MYSLACTIEVQHMWIRYRGQAGRPVGMSITSAGTGEISTYNRCHNGYQLIHNAL